MSMPWGILRYFYRDSTGDSSASHDYQEVEIDEHVYEIISMEPEDLNTVIDLREMKQVDILISKNQALHILYHVAII